MRRSISSTEEGEARSLSRSPSIAPLTHSPVFLRERFEQAAQPSTARAQFFERLADIRFNFARAPALKKGGDSLSPLFR
jgi:hypothetical protein